jgi:Cdc6-like AAA superfamily ATPase
MPHFDMKDVIWSDPHELPPKINLLGREDLLRQCRAAWGLNQNYQRIEEHSPPLHLRLEGFPGVGKNALVYELAREVAKAQGIPFYSMIGHEDLTPEDLAFLIVPVQGLESRAPFEIHASPLATAIRNGGVFFFDELNRVPERSLSPLAEVLDERQSLSSAVTGKKIEPKSDEARRNFYFCAAMNPQLGRSGYTLPEYIDQRTRPAFSVPNPDKFLRQILKDRVACSDEWLEAFESLSERELMGISVRQAISTIRYAVRSDPDQSPEEVLKSIYRYFLTRGPGPSMAPLAD